MAKQRKTESELQIEFEQAETARTVAKQQLDRQRLTRVTNDVIGTITSPEFMEKMSAARQAADDGEGMIAAAKLLSIEGLREAGADIPDDFRMTSRVFEDRVTGERLVVDSELRLPTVLGWGVCGGAGGLTFCGCGGFST